MDPVCPICSRPIKDGEPYIEVKISKDGELVRVHAAHTVVI